MRFVRPLVAAFGVMCLLVPLGACSGQNLDELVAAKPSGGFDIGADTGPVEVRLGYLPNITHASALVGLQRGRFVDELGENRLDARAFKAGPEVVEALFGDAIDIAFIGPNPAINAYSQSRSAGGAIRIVSGATAGGAALVVDDDVEGLEDLRGATIATPQLGNTQDVAARAWFADQGFDTNTSGGGDVSIIPMSNADALNAFRSGNIDGAWVPEPWVTRLVSEAKGRVLVDEAEIWPGGRFVTTQIVARTEFLYEHPDVVADLLRAHLAVLDDIESDPKGAQIAANAAIEDATGKPVADEVIAGAWKRLTFTPDPIAPSLALNAQNAVKVGLLDPTDLDGIYDLDVLNQLLAESGRSPISDEMAGP